MNSAQDSPGPSNDDDKISAPEAYNQSYHQSHNRPSLPAIIVFVALGIGIFIADQVSKYLARSEIIPGERIDFAGPLQLTLVFNDGVAFGLGSGSSPVLITAISLVGLGALLFLIWSAPVGKLSFFASALIVSGALGNLADRLQSGRVTDMLLLPSWPAFNIADTAITFGSLLLAATIINAAIKEERQRGATSPDGTPK